MQTDDLMVSFRRLNVGDIFLATYPTKSGNVGNGVFLIINRYSERIEARMVTTQWIVTFERSSLNSMPYEGVIFEVKAAQPLPHWAHSALVGLDKRYFQSGNPKLSKDEIQALVFVADTLEPDAS